MSISKELHEANVDHLRKIEEHVGGPTMSYPEGQSPAETGMFVGQRRPDGSRVLGENDQKGR